MLITEILSTFRGPPRHIIITKYWDKFLFFQITRKKMKIFNFIYFFLNFLRIFQVFDNCNTNFLSYLISGLQRREFPEPCKTDPKHVVDSLNWKIMHKLQRSLKLYVILYKKILKLFCVVICNLFISISLFDYFLRLLIVFSSILLLP